MLTWEQRLGAALVATAALSACGGSGGGTTSTPAPPAANPAPPAANPAPAPPASTPALPAPETFQTPEYNRSTGPSFHQAISAWQQGATGRNVAIGIVDTGIDTTNPEFAGRISSASADVAGSRGVNPQDDHGTLVALAAAAGRNGTGVMGIAYEATIMALRADSPGTCTQTDGCRFGDTAIAAGIDRAVTNGAKVINLSLGGGSAGSNVRAAVSRAASAGVVVVVAAGNDADSKTPSSDPNNPDPFAVSLRGAGNGNVIIAGSVNDSGTMSAFSNRAGAEANWYLNALGERICCVYENGAIKVTIQNGQQFVTVVSGTSFSAPQIAGAAALLIQAFPNLSAAQVVNLLLTSARDAGASGVDAVYGRGILDITRAFAPQGTTQLAGTTTTMALAGTSLATSPAMGDALAQGQLKTVVLDGYRRAYEVDLAGLGASPAPTYRLTGALVHQLRQVETGTDRLALAFSVGRTGTPGSHQGAYQLRLSPADAAAAKVLAARIVAVLSPRTTLGFALGQGGQGLGEQLRGEKQAAFLIAGDPFDDLGFAPRARSSMALRHRLGPWGLTVTAENAKAGAGLNGLVGKSLAARPGGAIERYALSADRTFGSLSATAGVSWLHESATVLGARTQDAFGSAGADSLFLDAGLTWRPGERWQLGAAWRQGLTRARAGGLIAPGSSLTSSAWSIDAARFGVFASADSVSFRLSQPLRVSSGGLNLSLPVAYDYTTLSATQGVRRLSLAPRGREMDAELAWRGRFAGGWATGSLFYRREPGHMASVPDDKGVAFSWSAAF